MALAQLYREVLTQSANLTVTILMYDRELLFTRLTVGLGLSVLKLQPVCDMFICVLFRNCCKHLSYHIDLHHLGHFPELSIWPPQRTRVMLQMCKEGGTGCYASRHRGSQRAVQTTDKQQACVHQLFTYDGPYQGEHASLVSCPETGRCECHLGCLPPTGNPRDWHGTLDISPSDLLKVCYCDFGRRSSPQLDPVGKGRAFEDYRL
eukprot:scpid6480/ scgid2953/ 